MLSQYHIGTDSFAEQGVLPRGWIRDATREAQTGATKPKDGCKPDMQAKSALAASVAPTCAKKAAAS